MANNGFNIKIGSILDTSGAEKAIGKLTKSIQTAVKTSSGELLTKQMNTYVKSVELADGAVRRYTKTFTSLLNAQGQYVDIKGRVLKQQGEELVKQEQTTKAVKSTTQAIKANTDALQAQGDVASRTSNIFSNFGESLTRIAYLKVANETLSLFTTACNQAREAILDLDNAIVEFNKVSDLKETGHLQQYIEELGELGQAVGRTQSEMLTGATQFVKSGFSEEDAKNLAEVNAMFQNVADSEMSAEESAQILIATMKAFNITADDTIHIVDTINSISNTQAVSSTDISDGLANVASTANAAKNSLEETAGMLAAMVTETQSAAKSSRGLRQIISRLTQTLDESSGTGEKLRDIYEGLGISLYDADGQLRSTYDILSELSEKWNTLSDNTKQYIALTSAGSNQVNNFLALMNNFDIAIESTATALDSAGSAAKENEATMDSIAMRIKTLQASFERLVNGQGGLNSFIKTMISSATAIIDFMNKIGGLKTAFTAMATTGIILAIANFEKLLKAAKMLKTELVALATFIPNQVVNALITLDNAAIGLAKAEEVAAANAVLLKTAIGGVVAVLGIALIAWQNYTRAQEEAQQAAVSTAEAYSDEVDAIQGKIKEIEDETTSREKLEEVIKNKLGSAYDQEKEDLKDINELREEALRLLYEEAQTKARETQRTTGSQYDKQKDYLNSSMMTSWEYSAKGIENPNFFSDAYKVDNTPEQALKEMGEELDRLNQKRQQGIELTREEKAEEKDLSEAYTELEKDINDAKTVVEAYEEAVATLAQTFKDWIAGNKDVSDSTNESANEMQRLGDIIKKYGYESYDDFAKAIENAGGSMDDFLDTLEESSEAAEEYVNTHLNIIDSVEELNEAIAEEKEALATLQEIANQYNETGQMTADMVQTLATISPQYVAALQNENGVLTVNTGLLEAQFEIQKELALINVEVAKQLAITAYCEQTLGEETSNTTTKLQDDEQQAYDLSSAYAQLTDAANRAAAAINRVRAEGKDDEAFYEGLREVQKTFDDMKDAIEQTEISTKDLSKAGKEVSKSHSSAAKKTEDAWKKAFDEEKKALDHMHEMNEISDEEYYNRLLELNEKYFGEASGQHEKYLDEYRKNEETAFKGLQKVYKDRLKKQTDAQLKALKQQKDAALKAIDAEIKGVKKAKDAALKAIDERIKAIKKQKDEAVKAIEAEIKALNKQKEAQHKYFQDRIDALQRAHDLQEQINQLEEYENQLAQAKAQRVWVMKDGQFQLGENEEAVNTAEQQLSDYKDDLDYERQLQELQDLQAYWDEYYDNLIEKKEEYKDYIEEYYDQQIEALEEYRDRVEEEYDAQIEALEEYRDQVEEMYDNMIEAYKEHVDAMLEAFDKFNEGNKEKYGTAIDDLRAFVAEWNGLIASMSSIDGAMSGVTGFMSSGMVSLKHHSGGAAEIGSYASGNGSSVKDDEIALVGESPNTEMLIGSKVNTGVVARLHKGSGVVNAESTKTLAGILNKLGKNKYIGNSSTEGSGVTQNFTFGSISLPNVTDANSFVEALRTTFGSYSVQYANAKA